MRTTSPRRAPRFATRGLLLGAVLTAGGDAATAVFRTGGAGGPVIARLATPANTCAEFRPRFAVMYSDLHVTLTGTAARVVAYA